MGVGPLWRRAYAPALTAHDWALFVLRVVLGVIFIGHGSQKVFGAFGGPGLHATVSAMGQGGIPSALAYLAAFTELLGGAAVLVGFLSRLGALGLAVVMSVAILKVHLPHGLFLQNKGYEFPLALLAMAVAIVLAGPGRLALMDLEARVLRRRVVIDSHP